MNRGLHAVNGWLALACAALVLPGPAAAAPRRDTALEAELMNHIRVLASDEYEGREPGTDGEAKTLRYLARQWFDIGMVSGTNDPGHEWFAPVTLIAREPASSSAQFTRKGRRQYVPRDAVLMLTSGRRSLVKDAARTILVPRPRTKPVAGEPIRDAELLAWCREVVDAVIDRPAVPAGTPSA